MWPRDVCVAVVVTTAARAIALGACLSAPGRTPTRPRCNTRSCLMVDRRGGEQCEYCLDLSRNVLSAHQDGCTDNVPADRELAQQELLRRLVIRL